MKALILLILVPAFCQSQDKGRASISERETAAIRRHAVSEKEQEQALRKEEQADTAKALGERSEKARQTALDAVRQRYAQRRSVRKRDSARKLRSELMLIRKGR